MKYFFCILFSLCCCSMAAAQENQTYTPGLILTKKNANTPRVLKVSPYSAIILKTTNGKKVKYRDYDLLGDSAIVAFADTVLLTDVQSIRTEIEISRLRQVTGNIMRSVGGVWTVVALVEGTSELIVEDSAAKFLQVLPPLAVTYLGELLVGKRRYKTSKWKLSIAK